MPSLLPALPVLCRKDETSGGTEQSISVERSPMSIPISSVGVQESRFGSQGLRPSLLLKDASSAVLSPYASSPVCSAG